MALTDNLVEFWTLNNTRVGAVGETVLLSGDGSDYYVDPGKIGQGWSGNGTSQRRLSVVSSDLQPSGSFSISIWAKQSTGMISSTVAAFGDDGGERWRLQVRGTAIQVYRDSVSVLSAFRIADNAFVHLVVTYDAVSDSGALFINGAKVLFSATTPGTGTNPTVYLCGGKSTQCSTIVDSYGIWIGTILTDAEVAELYNSGAGWEYAPVASVVTNILLGSTVETCRILNSRIVRGMP
jgi:hypothetical protein